MDNRIRILQVMGHFGSGGVEALIMNYYREIDKNKFIFDFVAEEESTLEFKNEIENNGGKLFIVPKMKHIHEYNLALKKILLNYKYDMIQSNINSLSIFPLRIAKKCKVKIRIANSLSTTHRSEGKRYIVKSILKRFSKCYANSYFYCSNLAGEWLFGRKIHKKSNSYKIFNAINEEKFMFDSEERKRIRMKYNLSNDFVVGTCGRMVKQKNQLFLLDIFYEIVKINNNSKLILVGDGDLRESIIDKIKRLNLEKKVLVLGQKELGLQDQMHSLYNAMDCFLLPSLYEGLPMVSIEAQINSLPCFFSNNITSEVKITDDCEFLSLKEKPKTWAERILEYKVFQRKKIFVSDYNIKIQKDILMNIYSQLYEENAK